MASNDDGNFPHQEPMSDYEQADSGVDTMGAPAVAAAPGKLFLMLFGGAAFFFVALYFIFSGDGKKEPIATPTKLQTPAKKDFDPMPPTPPTPIEVPPTPIPTPPPAEEVPPLPPMEITSDPGPTDEKYLERLRSEMMVFNNTTGAGAAFEDQRKAENDLAANDPNLGFAQKAMRASAASPVKAGHIGDLYSTIAQGKLIHGVVESAINTQLPGSIRAVVSRDTYAEAGSVRLIPKGSRLIGIYNTDIFRGQSRVFVVWTRIIRPDGIDIMVNSPGVDKLGRAGLEGAVDGKFRELFATALITSVITIGAATVAESVVDSDSTTTRGADGSTTTSGSASAEAVSQSIANIGGVGKRVIDNVIDTRPVIEIDQGTKINVMVNRDMVFPSSVMQQTTFVE